MSNLHSKLSAPQIFIAFAMIAAFFGPGVLLVVLPDNPTVSFLFGGAQIFVFWIVSIFGLHLVEKRWSRYRSTSRNNLDIEKENH